MKFYNSLTRQREEFIPQKGNDVYIYSCGPTVYNYAHIGNFRTYIFMDLLRRSLKWNGYKLHHVMNITDVGHLVSDGDEGEDKMAKTAREQAKTPWEIAEYYTKIFMRDIERLNIEKPEIIAHATDHIPEMIAFVSGLVERGYAYETSDGIYFDVLKFSEYGMLSGNKLEEQKAGARVEINDEKHHPADFAVWKKAPREHIMQWESPWGMGYPGWHIECSAMGLKYLGEYFDIHTGGVDHIPIHHENEIAQTCGLLGHPAAKYWLHGEFMLVDGGKMSKSLNNVYTLDQLNDLGYKPCDFRYFCLNAHYRQKLNFTFEGLNAAKKSLSNLKNALLNHKNKPVTEETTAVSEKYYAEFCEAVSDDLNIPRALGIVWNLVKYETKSQTIYDKIMEMDKILAVNLDVICEDVPEDTVDDDLSKIIEEKIKMRADAKKQKNYSEADNIRSELESIGIILTDTPAGTTWKKK